MRNQVDLLARIPCLTQSKKPASNPAAWAGTSPVENVTKVYNFLK